MPAEKMSLEGGKRREGRNVLENVQRIGSGAVRQRRARRSEGGGG